MRVAPTVTLSTGGQVGFPTSSGLGYQSAAGFRVVRVCNATTASGYYLDSYVADAEL